MLDIITFIFTIFIVILVVVFTYFVTKWLSTKIGVSQNGKNIRIIERVAVSNDKIIVIVMIAKKYHVLVISQNNTYKICELDENEVDFANQNETQSFSSIFQSLIKKGESQANDDENNIK